MKQFILLAFMFLFVSCTTKEAAEKPPNIIIIFTDDQGYEDVGVFGSPDIETPHLDKMASEGIKLTSFYAAQAVCSASRAALLTGCYPNRIGIHQAFMPGAKRGLRDEETTIAEMLKPLGYNTAIFGKWHLGDTINNLPLAEGFDEYYGIPYSNDMWPYHPQQESFNFGPLPLYEGNNIIDTLTDQSFLTTAITERSVEFIRKNKDSSFFLYVAHPQPHVPLFVSDKFRGKSERGLYGDVIMEIDWSVGQILAALRDEGIDDHTLVIFTSDNGPWLSYGDHAGSAGPFREGKGTAFEGGHREPFIARWPGNLPAGETINTPVMAIDILPTIAHITGADLPRLPIDGRNVWPVLNGATTESPQPAYFFYYRVNELFAVRSGDWKMYFPHRYRTLNGREGGTGGLPAPYDYIQLEDTLLYNLADDPSEVKDRFGEFPEVEKRLLKLADSIRHELGDRLTGIEGIGSRDEF